MKTTGRIVVFGWADSVHIHRWAAGLTDRGYAVKVISLDGWEVSGCETVIFPRTSRWSYVAHASAAAREAVAFRPDIVHVHYVTGFGLWGLKTRRSPLVVSVWGSDLAAGSLGLLGRHLVRKTFARAARITATSQYLKNRVRRFSPKGGDITDVIPFGVEPVAKVTPLPSLDPLRLCFIKLHKRYYGPDVLLKALDLVRKTIPNVRLSLAGRGDMTDQLRGMVADLDLADQVDFVGFVDNKDIYSFIARHHIVVMPSREEAFGVAALEAGMCGRPVIGSAVGGLPEVVRDDRTGVLVAPDNPRELADAIIRMAKKPDMMTAMGAEAHRFVRANFSWQRSLDLMSGLYERLIHGEE